jgi:hypothetical protein
MRLRTTLLTPLLFLGTSMLGAQTARGAFEITPFAGYLFGGEVLEDTRPEVGTIVRADLADHVSYGLRLGYAFPSGWEPELEWTSVHTDLEVSTGTTYAARTDYLLGGAAFHFGSGSLRPYAGMAAGAARVSGPFPAEARFTGRVSLGLKAFVTPWLALRVEAAGYATRLGEMAYGASCTTFPDDENPGVPVSCMNTWLLQANVGGGLVFAF